MADDTNKELESLRKSELEKNPLKSTSESLLKKIQQFEEAQLIDNSVAVFTEETRKNREDVETKLNKANEAFNKADQATIASKAWVIKVTDSENALKNAEENLDKVKRDLTRLQKDRDEKKAKLDATPSDDQLKKEFDAASTAADAQSPLVESATTDLNNAKLAKDTADKELKTAIDNEINALTDAKKTREEFEAAANRFNQLKAGMEALNSRIKAGTFLTIFEKLTSPAAISAFLVVFCIAFFIFLYFLLTSNFLNKIQNIDFARGLITTTIALVSVVMAIVLVLYPITGKDDGVPPLKDRFMMSKEILMLFVGILGTIVGFHYGSDHGSTGSVSENFIVSPNEVQAGSPTTLVSVLTHGTPPYTYEVSSEPAGFEKKGQILDNVINVQLNAPADKIVDTPYTITLTATDSKGTEIAKLKRLVMVKKPPTVTGAAGNTQSGGTSETNPSSNAAGNQQPNGTSETIPELTLKADSIRPGEKLELEGKIAPGGIYRIKTVPSLKIGKGAADTTDNRTSADGNIKESILLPEDVPPNPYTITLELLKPDGITLNKSVSKPLMVITK